MSLQRQVVCLTVVAGVHVFSSWESLHVSWLVGVQISKVLQVVCSACSVPFPPVSLQRQVVCLTVVAGVHVFSSWESL